MVRGRGVLALVAAVAVMVTALCFEPMRGLAGEFLDIFRVHKFKVISITPEDMAKS